jgi:MFS family permease
MAFTTNMYVYGVALSISGFFSATFALTFAYISDCVDSKHRAPAYGLALATFGLSFTIGPIAGGYIAAQFGEHMVFLLALVLVAVNVLYILFKLPETAKLVNVSAWNLFRQRSHTARRRFTRTTTLRYVAFAPSCVYSVVWPSPVWWYAVLFWHSHIHC